MSERVVLAWDVAGKSAVLYNSLSEASRELGVTRQAIAYAVKNKGVCAGKTWRWVPRIFAVKTAGRYWICRIRQGVFTEMSDGRQFKKVDKAVDITFQMWNS